MRYSVLGFNQAEVIKTDLDLTDLMLLKYIIESCGSTNMWHKLDSNGKPRVWISHTHLCADLPILRISEGTLRNRLSSLNQRGYIKTTVVANDNGRGSRTYYGITDTVTHLLYDYEEQTTTSQNNDMVSRPRHEKMTSDNLLKDNNRNISNTKVLEETATKKPKQNLYQKCYSDIEEFTEDEEVRNVLVTYLKMRLEMKDKPMYSNQWKGMLNKLRELTESKTEVKKIIQQSIDRGYLSFFPLSQKKNNVIDGAWNKTVKSVAFTEEDKQHQEEFLNKMNAEGKQTVF